MRELALIAWPITMSGLAFAWPSERTRPFLLPLTAAIHTALTLWLLASPSDTPLSSWVGFDPLAQALVPCVSVLFLVCAAYSAAYLRLRVEHPNRVFTGALLALLGTMSLALQARHLGLLWVAAEGATLATVPLLHFNATARALEATWKYLLVGGTGLALALLGTFCLGYASVHGGGQGDLTFVALAEQGAQLSRPWVLAAWVLLLVGYGTKMGLAPMHTWKPDAYGEAPGVVGSLLAGGITTVAFAAILRVRNIVDAAGAGAIASRSLLLLGLFSLLVAAVFLLGTRDFKRMLAYSSIEHMGILSLGAALGVAGLAPALFHVWSNSFTKASLFLSAGNIRRAAAGRTVDDVSGMSVLTPRSSALFVTGLFAITACPPFAPFFSQLGILRAAIAADQRGAVVVFLLALLLAFLGMSRLVFRITDGRPRADARAGIKRFAESPGVLIPPLVLLLVSLWLGVAAPAPLREIWARAAAQMYGLP